MTEEINLIRIRQEIDIIDAELVNLLETRMSLVEQVADYKRATGKVVLDSSREEAVLAEVARQVNRADYLPAILATFKDIMQHSRDFQQQKNDL